MKLLIVLLLFSLTGCAEFSANKTLYVASTAALIADWGQTRYISENPAQWHESNRYLGLHPSASKVDKYFTGWVLGNTLMLFVLPDKWQPYWFGSVLGVEVMSVGNNSRLGIKFDWGL